MSSRDEMARAMRFLTANTSQEAERVARGKDIVVLEVVPRWRFASRDWVDGDREIWKAAAK